MAIKLEVQPYCANCTNFEPDVIRPMKTVYIDGEVVVGDTIVRCDYAKRCENIKKFLARQEKEEKN